MLCFCVTLWRLASATLTIFLCWTVELNEISMKMEESRLVLLVFPLIKVVFDLMKSSLVTGVVAKKLPSYLTSVSGKLFWA